MTNAHASKQHGLVGKVYPKSKLRKRRNKELYRKRNAGKKSPKQLLHELIS